MVQCVPERPEEVDVSGSIDPTAVLRLLLHDQANAIYTAQEAVRGSVNSVAALDALEYVNELRLEMARALSMASGVNISPRQAVIDVMNIVHKAIHMSKKWKKNGGSKKLLESMTTQ